MMRCISSVTYVVKINGIPRGCITQLGIYTEGPFVPFCVFEICRGPPAMIKKVIGVGTLKGVSTCKRGPSVSHLLFADDSLILCKAAIEECEAL